MQINVIFRHTDASTALKEYAEDKFSRVKKYMLEPITADVVLRVEKFRHIAEVAIDANGIRVNGVEETGDLYSAIDMVADKIEAQLKKQKDKMRDHKSPGDKGSVRSPEGLDEAVEDSGDRRVITREQQFAKPMDVEEAVMQLELSTGEFLVFTNSQSSQINVLYRRSDGHFGMIEPVQ